MGRIIPYSMENKTCLKPQTSHLLGLTNYGNYINYMIYGLLPDTSTIINHGVIIP